ncbi:MAG: class I SAM-dependent RNA methyltransferase [Fusobacteriaceae bacterium]|jgi:putative N6-adenine-specific DNA methylase|nr:class I SAM-dependent RNA methyltransferase [Fusobacteriaceae bacterium]
MENYIFIASASMGLESIVRDECQELNFKNVVAFNGRVEFEGTLADIPKANINLRCADRAFIKMGEFKATTFEELFQNIKKIPWETIIDINGEFPISWVSSVKSKLYSLSDIQKITKKAIVERLKSKYRKDLFPENGARYSIKLQANKDIFIVMIDTSGEPLHKRGYRKYINLAPLKETMAAALVKMSHWNGNNLPLVDPMCGTGTIAIEAAMIARNIAPGANRNFESEKWKIIPEEYWINARDEAYSKENLDKSIKIYASDIDSEVIKIATENAKKAGLLADIEFKCADFRDLHFKESHGSLITNPPYGDRLLTYDEVAVLYQSFGEMCVQSIPKWSYYIITSYENFETIFGKKATKNRKLYNGGIKCYYYQYYGEKLNKLKNTMEA